MTPLISENNNYNRNYVKYIAIFLLILVSLIIVPSSPLSKGNIWVDTNAMLEIGRGWLSGNIPYLHMFEQRGPILFIYNLIANVISSHGYFGLFCIEIANFLAIFFITDRILMKCFNNSINPFIATVLPFFMMIDKSFETGGSPEEFAITWSLLGILTAISVSTEPMKNEFYRAVIFGITIGMVFWIKFTLLGPLIGASIFIFLFLLTHQRYKYLIKFVVDSLLSFSVMSSVICFYFFYHHALKNLYNVYFKVNIMAYGGNTTINEKIISFINTSFQTITTNSWLFSLALAGIFILWRLQKKLAKLLLVVSLISFIVTYLVGQARLYSFLQIYTILILIIIISTVALVNNINKSYLWILLLLALFPIIQNPFFSKAPYIWSKNPVAPKLFGEIINRECSDAKLESLVYYNIVDAGVERYTPIKVSEKFKYFERTNVPDKAYPEQKTYLDRIINNSEATYVVIGLNWGRQKSINLENNHEVESKIPEQVQKKYKVISASYSYYPVETDMNQFQLALLKKR